MSTSPVANSLINKCSELQGEVSALLSTLNQKHGEIDALKTSLKVLGYVDCYILLKHVKNATGIHYYHMASYLVYVVNILDLKLVKTQHLHPAMLWLILKILKA